MTHGQAQETAQAEAVAFLTAGADEIITTHISRIFLRGDRAIKLKRAVCLPYLDFTTLAARAHFCTRELALNARTAPGLYLGLRRLTRAAGGLEWDGAGALVETVLEMRRFPETALLANMAAAGRLPPALLRDLADEIAQFHAGCPLAAGSSLAAVVAGNAQALDACPDLDPQAVSALQMATDGALAALGPALQARAKAGRVRRGHGDLHLGNVVMLAGRPCLFDALEFSEALASVDVLYDLAFLLMDLCHAGQKEAAALVLNRYLDVSGDEEGMALLPLFISVRAAIRAHVSGSQGKGQAARAYLAQAQAALRPARPVLLAVGGPSGAGKSSLAAALAPAIGALPGARVLRSDVLRKRLAGLAPETRLPAASYTGPAGAAVYAEMLRLAGQYLQAGVSVVLDASFLAPATREMAAALAARLRVPGHFIWLQAPPEMLAARLAARRGDASDAGPALLPAQLAGLVPPPDWQRLDAAQSPQALCRLVLAHPAMAGMRQPCDLRPHAAGADEALMP